jgi:hypothetical protein
MGDDSVISAEASKRTCEHMNDDHAVSVYAMARLLLRLPAGVKLTDARLKKVTMDGCHLSVATCRGDLCEMKQLVYEFDPRLESPSQVRSRLVAVHQKVCEPRWQWLVATPVAVAILCMTYGTWLGVPQMTDMIESAKEINVYVSKVFGSANMLALLIRFFFYFIVVAHTAEATWAAYKCRTVLKLQAKPTLMWFGMVLLLGYTVLPELLTLLTVNRVSKEAAAAKKSR